MYNIGELIEVLTDLRDNYGPEARVRIAYQPNYPLTTTLSAVTLDCTRAEMAKGGTPILWLATGDAAPYDESPYAPRHAWDGDVVEDEPRTPSPEMLDDVLKAGDRSREGRPALTIQDIVAIFGTLSILAEVEELLELLPGSEDGQLEVKWGNDDAGVRTSTPVDNPTLHEQFNMQGWRIARADDAVYVSPVPDEGAGPVVFWFSPLSKAPEAS